jgi:hypothetical protein
VLRADDCSFDTTLWLYDQAGVELTYDDDLGTLCSRIEMLLAPGTYFIRELPYDAWRGIAPCRTGDYSLVISSI